MPDGRSRATVGNLNLTSPAFFFLCGLATALCLGCQNDLTRYYPLDSGFAWRYRVSLANNHELVTTSADVVNLHKTDMLGRAAVPQRSEMFGESIVRYLTIDGGGVLEYAQQGSDGSFVDVSSPNYVLRLPVADGTTWSSTWQSTRDGTRISVPTVKAVAATGETVMVPAGTFAGCLRLHITGKAENTSTGGPATIEVQGDEWYAPEIGFIKGSFREIVNDGRIITELSMDLESFTRP